MKITLIIISAGIFLAGCTGSAAKDAIEKKNHSNAAKTSADNIVSFKAGGEEIVSSGWNISLFKLIKTGDVYLNISSNMHKDSRTINANIGGITPGTYHFEEGSATTYGNYYPDYKKDLLNNFSFVSGSFIITELDTVKHMVNATFSGTVKNKKGQQLAITDGRIVNGKLNEKIQEY